ncbi:MAG: hypothetical protein JW795_18800 [Chitinivibrionales bacterium]|nr:hypothetical protein [Chitinivibrionales bacterium]
MATSKRKRTNSILLGFCAVAIVWIIGETIFMRFVHYDSQYRLLNPEHYNAEVITQEDYKQLSNPENRTVALSNGSTLTKSEIWDSHVLPNYKSVNNDSQYVLVTLRGTAPFMSQWYSGVMPIVIGGVLLALLGLISKRFQED